MSAIRREFVKTLFQKRTYIGWAGLFVIPFLMMLAFRFASESPHGQAGTNDIGAMIFTQIRDNGMYLIVASLMAMVTFFLPLLASMAGSYTVSGEAEKGTLRTMLMQPIRRGALLMAKWLVANIYVAICLLLLGAAALIAGGSVFGLDPVRLFTGQEIGVWHAIGLAAGSYLFVFVGMMCVVSLAVLFSTLTDSSLTAVAAALILVIIMEALGAFEVFDFLRPYMFPSRWDAWTNFLSSPVDWDPVIKALMTFAVWIVGTTGLAYWRFRGKDVLS
jgi:ABC-type transport system involved in multi-copper enzyme maturation permease subunit